MNNLNTVLMEGTLIRDPERSNQVTGSSQCRLSLANNRYYFGRNDKWVQDASFFTVWVSGPVAESCLKFLKKGRGIRVVGRLKQLRYSMGGISREKVAILAEHIEFQPARKTDDTESVRIPGELQTKSDSSIALEEKTAEEVPASGETGTPQAGPVQDGQESAGQAETAGTGDPEPAGPENFDDAGPDCTSEEDVPETDVPDTPF